MCIGWFMKTEAERTLPSKFWGDPSECVDELRRLRIIAKRQAYLDMIHKGRRIKALVSAVIKNGGDKHGKR